MVLKLEHWRHTTHASYSERTRISVTGSGNGDRLLHCKITKNQRICCKGARNFYFGLDFLNVLYSKYDGYDPCRTVSTLPLTVRRSDRSGRSHSSSARHNTHWARSHKHWARSHKKSARFHPQSARFHSQSAVSHPQSARSHSQTARSHSH